MEARHKGQHDIVGAIATLRLSLYCSRMCVYSCFLSSNGAPRLPLAGRTNALQLGLGGCHCCLTVSAFCPTYLRPTLVSLPSYNPTTVRSQAWLVPRSRKHILRPEGVPSHCIRRGSDRRVGTAQAAALPLVGRHKVHGLGAFCGEG